MTRSIRLTALVLLLASPTMPGAIQTAAFAQSGSAPAAQTPVTPPQVTPPPVAVPQVAPPPQPIVWRTDAAEELLRYIGRVGEEGLDPATYAPDAAARGACRRRSRRPDTRSPARPSSA